MAQVKAKTVSWGWGLNVWESDALDNEIGQVLTKIDPNAANPPDPTPPPEEPNSSWSAPARPTPSGGDKTASYDRPPGSGEGNAPGGIPGARRHGPSDGRIAANTRKPRAMRGDWKDAQRR